MMDAVKAPEPEPGRSPSLAFVPLGVAVAYEWPMEP